MNTRGGESGERDTLIINDTVIDASSRETSQPVTDNALLISCDRIGVISAYTYADVEAKAGKEILPQAPFM